MPGLSPSAAEVARSHLCQANSAHRQASGGARQPAVPSREVSAPPAPQNAALSCCAALKAPKSRPSDPGGVTSLQRSPAVGHGWIPKPRPQATLVPGAVVAVG